MRGAIAIAVLMVACGGNERGTHVMMDWSRANGLFDAPYPSDDLLVGGHPNVAAFPNPKQVTLIEQARALAADRDGYSGTSGVYFQISTAIDPTGLPDLIGSVASTSTVQLIGLADGKRYPVQVTFETQAGLYGAPNLLAAIPLQGVPLPKGTYAAIVTTDLHDAGGASLASATDDDLAPWKTQVAATGIDRAHIAGMTVFTTGSPTDGLAAARTYALTQPLPVPGVFTRTDLFADFCAYHAVIDMPDYQSGTPPFDATGGTWMLDASGNPILQRTETANLVVTLPRSAPPQGGYPLVVFIRTGGGGDRPLVDRGQQAAEGGPAIEPGEGPARYLARAGFAGIEVDGPLGGLRNTTNGDEQFLTFNVTNLGAMRDNIRESALELQILAHTAAALRMNATDCPPAGTSSPGPADVGFDATHVAIMGHSMGAWIAPIAAADEPMFGAMIIDGAGGSWIENIMWKQKPTPVYPVIAAFVHEGDLKADDPVLSFSQWALEPADPQVYTAKFAARGGHVLMVQGIVDDYILPNIANATSLSLGLDLAGPEHDTESDPRLANQRPIGPLLSLVARSAITLPASGNHGAITAVVTQHLEDGIEDGHEVMFQTDAPKHEYQCFLASWVAKGVPMVDVDATRDAPCPP